MSRSIPPWAFEEAAAAGLAAAQEARRQGTMQITWPDSKALRAWAKQHGFPTPWFGFEDAFVAHLLSAPERFAAALAGSGIAIRIPKREHTITAEQLQQLDALYESREPGGRPDQWGSLVEELREVRRAVEAGVAVHIEGEQTTLGPRSFYGWAHSRYHMLEDGYDKWIGDDR